MSRLNAAWFNFTKRGQVWDHFWQDATIGGETHSGFALISGNGTTSGMIQKGGQGSATISAIGILMALGLAAMFGMTVLSGNPGHQIATGQKAISANAIISENGSLISSGDKGALNSEIISCGGFIFDIGIKTGAGIAGPISSDGIQVATGEKIAQAEVAISGNGSLAASGIAEEGIKITGEAIISGNGFLVSVGEKAAFASINIVGNGLLAGIAQTTREGLALISAGCHLYAHIHGEIYVKPSVDSKFWASKKEFKKKIIRYSSNSEKTPGIKRSYRSLL